MSDISVCLCKCLFAGNSRIQMCVCVSVGTHACVNDRVYACLCELVRVCFSIQLYIRVCLSEDGIQTAKLCTSVGRCMHVSTCLQTCKGHARDKDHPLRDSHIWDKLNNDMA